ncbi:MULTISPECIES: acyl carrier protein [unclassified Crossiella]|uniref:acyl carrier protein n=1 Tax=unclassified Crossiella TaxID=2620835 RepID=UPI001FFFA154|nr:MULTISPECIES: acyl carrier protein [unclassified Crossiella]MCK2239827.1 acyl carrier protein [Crossiella sp. S99.2]MCK2252535.1 acyl carrier protein [Crossiella sp. S99.1]
MTALLDQLTALLTTRFGVPPEEVRAEATFADLDLDSLALVELGLVTEKEFGVRVKDDEVSTSDTLATIAKLIESKREAA